MSKPELEDAEQMKNLNKYLQWVNNTAAAANAQSQALEAKTKQDQLEQQNPEISGQLQKQEENITDQPDTKQYP